MRERLIGRGPDLAVLETFLDAAAHRPMFLALLGAAGIGKSALLRTLGERATERGFRVVAEDGLRALFRDWAPPAALARPHRALADWLHSDRPVSPADEPALITGMVLALDDLTATAPRLILLDRADALDAESRRLLTMLMRDVTDVPVAVVLAARGTEPPPGIGSEIDRHVVAPLDETSAARLLGPAVTGSRRDALRRAAGNPAVLLSNPAEEYAQVLADLPPLTRELLTHAARSAEPVDALTRAAGGAGLRDWEPAERAGVIEIAGGRVRFTHPMYREGLTARPGDDDAYQAGEPGWAVEQHRGAGRAGPELAGVGHALIQLARPAEALELVRTATAGRHGGPMSLAAVAATAVMVSGRADHFRQLPGLLDELDRDASEAGPAAGTTRALLTGTLAWRWDDSDRAAADLSTVRQAGRPGPVITALPLLIPALMDSGRWSEAAALVEEAEHLAAVSGAVLLDAVLPALRGTLTVWRGEEAEPGPLPAVAASSTFVAYLHHRGAGLAALAAGEHADAYGSFRKLYDTSGRPVHPVLGPHGLPQLAQAAVGAGRADEARAIVAAGRPATRRAAMLRDHAAGVLDGAEESFRRAVGHRDVARRWPLEHAEAQFSFATWLRRQRRLRDSRPRFQAALDTFQRLGAHAHAEHTRRYLPGAGADGSEPGAALAALPAQKQRIARLAADGLKNIEIARALNVSPRTVSSYLHDIFPRLGVDSRHQLRELLTANRAG
ncbi:LuxR family transcriptional regulator [Actinoplanes sp. TRM 88003]|uniref:LuxR family transcriptional regulator n=1 Tax=Paractinoplanes aksuensis TaxID=2939490 RepID=A0ABT1DS72_9ACTN|nr:LuxR family transcriptional regulator [Actinoplanes aksuensis]MCO8273687.1 LuxR family transcriptional regulator [Actinoplanes aksuensis]